MRWTNAGGESRICVKAERDCDGGTDQSERVKESTETEWKDAALLCTGRQSERGK